MFTVLAAGVAAGSCGAFLQVWDPPWSVGREIGERGASGSAVFRVIDRTLPRSVPIPAPGMILAELEMLGLSGEMERPVSGRILLRIPDGAPTPGYGDRLHAEGIFERSSETSGFFRFENIRKREGACAVFRAENISLLGTVRFWDSGLLAFRDRLLAFACAGVDVPERRAMISQLFFGCRPGLDGETRRDLIRAGTIHLFCVSGLHVAVLAGIVLLALRPLPLHVRYSALTAFTLAYVLSTGAGAPAMRAFLLIALLSGLRIFRYSEPPFRLLMLVAAGLIVFRPFYLVDLGFLYSFIITAALVLLLSHARRWRKCVEEIDVWRGGASPPWMERFARRAGFYFTGALASCVAAFLGGAALSMYFQGLLLPGSILANLLVLPIVGLLFPLLGLKIAAAVLWSAAVPVCNLLLLGALGWLDAVSGVCATFFGAAGAIRPSPVWAVIFYTALALLLAGGRVRRLAGTAGLCVCFAWWLGASYFRPSSLLLGSSGEGPPFMIFRDAGADFTAVVNVPDFAAAGAIEKYLAESGIPRIDLLAFSGGKSGHMNGAPALARRIPVLRVEPPGEGLRSPAAKKRFESLLEMSRLAPGVGIFRVESLEGTSSVCYRNFATKNTLLLRFPEATPGVSEVRFNGVEHRHILGRTNTMELFYYE